MNNPLAILVKGKLDSYVKKLAKEHGSQPEEIRVVIKIEKGIIGVFLFNNSKFVKRIEMNELVKNLM